MERAPPLGKAGQSSLTHPKPTHTFPGATNYGSSHHLRSHAFQPTALETGQSPSAYPNRTHTPPNAAHNSFPTAYVSPDPHSYEVRQSTQPAVRPSDVSRPQAIHPLSPEGRPFENSLQPLSSTSSLSNLTPLTTPEGHTISPYAVQNKKKRKQYSAVDILCPPVRPKERTKAISTEFTQHNSCNRQGKSSITVHQQHNIAHTPLASVAVPAFREVLSLIKSVCPHCLVRRGEKAPTEASGKCKKGCHNSCYRCGDHRHRAEECITKKFVYGLCFACGLNKCLGTSLHEHEDFGKVKECRLQRARLVCFLVWFSEGLRPRLIEEVIGTSTLQRPSGKIEEFSITDYMNWLSSQEPAVPPTISVLLWWAKLTGIYIASGL